MAEIAGNEDIGFIMNTGDNFIVNQGKKFKDRDGDAWANNWENIY